MFGIATGEQIKALWEAITRLRVDFSKVDEARDRKYLSLVREVQRHSENTDRFANEVQALRKELDAWKKVCAELTDKTSNIVTTVGIHSEHMMELDKRISKAETAPTIPAFPSIKRIEEPKAAKQLPLRQKQYFTRTNSKRVAEAIVDSDTAAMIIKARALKSDVPEDIVDACIAAGIAQAIRRGRPVVIGPKYRRDAGLKYCASVHIAGDSVRSVGRLTEAEQRQAIADMEKVKRIAEIYFNHDEARKGRS